MVERLHGMQEVVSSSLICSTLPAVLLRGFFLERKSHRFRDGIILFIRSRIYSLPSTLGTPEGQLEQPQASGTEPQALLGTVFPLQGGVREGLFCRVVRLLERAEESCEGLKHGYYDLPCVCFLSSLCHELIEQNRQVGYIL